MLVRALGGDRDRRAARRRQQQHAHDALAVHRRARRARRGRGPGSASPRGRTSPPRARACPAGSGSSTSRDGHRGHGLGSRPRSRSEATQMALRPCSRISRATASRSADLAQARQLDQHRQVHAGDDLDPVPARETSSPRLDGVPPNMSVSTRTPVPAAHPLDGLRDLLARVFTSSCQPIETAVNCGRSPTIVSAAFTSSVASCRGSRRPRRSCSTIGLRGQRPASESDRPAASSRRLAPCRDGRTRICTPSRSASDLPQRLGDHHRAVPAAGAADGHRQVALAFVHVLRQRGTAASPPASSMNSRVTALLLHERRRRRGPARSAAAARGTKCGFGRKRTSNTRSASTGTPCLKPKLRSVTTQRRAAPRARATAP